MVCCPITSDKLTLSSRVNISIIISSLKNNIYGRNETINTNSSSKKLSIRVIRVKIDLIQITRQKKVFSFSKRIFNVVKPVNWLIY